MSTRARISHCGSEPGFSSTFLLLLRMRTASNRSRCTLTRDFAIFASFLVENFSPRLERSITWSAGIMYDAPNHQWLIRQTGVMIAVPELWGHFFIGRTKEGFSLNKVMTGYDGWTMERATISDASIPILADGIKWLGYSPKHKFLWNVGYFNDVLSKDQSFSTYSSQVVGRFVLLPITFRERKQGAPPGCEFSVGQTGREQTSTQVAPGGLSCAVFRRHGFIPIGLDPHGRIRSLLPHQSLAFRK